MELVEGFTIIIVFKININAPTQTVISTRTQIQQTLLHQINCPTSTKQSSFVSAHRALFLPIGGKEHIERSICEHEPEYDYIIIA